MDYNSIENLYKDVNKLPYKIRAKVIDFHFFHEQFLNCYGDVIEGVKKMNQMCEEIDKDLKDLFLNTIK
jgi:archaellum component FlaC